MTAAIEIQQTRRKHLSELMETHHRPGGYGDYDDSYEEFEHRFFPWTAGSGDVCPECGGADMHAAGCELAKAAEAEPEDVPKYAAVRTDETYGMIEVFDALGEAIAAESASIGEEYLMNPAGVFDLDTGQRVETVQVGMSKEAFIVLCGLVQPNWLTSDDPDAVNHAGIYSEAWDELRSTFPLDIFRKAAQERGEDFYNEEAGT